MSRATSAYGVTLPNPESGPKRTVLPTLPAARFSRLIATRVGVAFVPVTAIPPPTARPGLPCAKTSATCLIVSTGTSLSAAAFLTLIPVTTSAKRRSASPASTITLRIASASSPSVPGAFRTHASAFDAVSDCRGSM